eukprot:scaffold7285_cov59-Phaeocystis_antarctica.AAC.3
MNKLHARVPLPTSTSRWDGPCGSSSAQARTTLAATELVLGRSGRGQWPPRRRPRQLAKAPSNANNPRTPEARRRRSADLLRRRARSRRRAKTRGQGRAGRAR